NDDPLRFDDGRCDLEHEGDWVGFTATEYRLLKLLYSSAEEVLSKPFLYQQVLHRGYSQHDRSLDMHISNIRRKLTRAKIAGLRVEAVWGKGYLLSRQES
ncbi:winged helix-turn-helix domain-containing protein, partial [Stutzerimonas nitrititolerans]